MKSRKISVLPIHVDFFVIKVRELRKFPMERTERGAKKQKKEGRGGWGRMYDLLLIKARERPSNLATNYRNKIARKEKKCTYFSRREKSIKFATPCIPEHLEEPD